MAVDMKTIAEMLGVSKTTVHRALTNTGRISPQTKAKILKAAKELDYRPNNLARGLRSQKSATIGIVSDYIASTLFSAILEGIEQTASLNGYNVLVSCSHGIPTQEVTQLDILREKRVDGMIIATDGSGANLKYFRRMQEMNMPFVFIDRHLLDLDTDYVATDNFAGGYLAGKHLASLGRRRLAFAYTPRMEQEGTTVRDRILGFTKALEEQGMKPVDFIGEKIPGVTVHHEYARLSIRKYLEDGKRVDGILAVNDCTAVGLIRGLAEMGLKVPDDVAIVGYDDLDIAAFIIPSLTTIRQPKHLIGQEAVSILLDRIGKKTVPDTFKHVLLEPELIIRESCGVNLQNR